MYRPFYGIVKMDGNFQIVYQFSSSDSSDYVGYSSYTVDTD